MLTPHYSAFMPRQVIEGRISRVGRFLQGIPQLINLEILTAGELLIHGFSLDNLEAIRYPGTGYVLVEFSSGITWLETLLFVRRIRKKGYTPLIAHPERYYWCRKRGDRLVSLSRMGCGALISARSLLHEKYALTARRLLSRGLAHAVSSDAHSPSDYILDANLKHTLKESSVVPWEVLTREIPSLILDDRPLPNLPLRRDDW